MFRLNSIDKPRYILQERMSQTCRMHDKSRNKNCKTKVNRRNFKVEVIVLREIIRKPVVKSNFVCRIILK